MEGSSVKSQRPTVADADSQPWWRLGIMWLVVGGPLVVVVAATVTAVIAARGADTLVEDPTVKAAVATGSDAPAAKARNHAVTPPPSR